MLFLSHILSACSGKLNGSVFSRNRGGQYVKTWVSPDQTSTTEREAVWDAMAAIGPRWATITDAQRQAWSAYSIKHKRASRLGVTRPAGGFQEFTRANITPQQANNLLGNTFEWRDGPPTGAQTAPVRPPTCTLIDGNATLHIVCPSSTQYEDSDDAGLAIWIGTPSPATRLRFYGNWTLVACTANPHDNNTTDVDLTGPQMPASGQSFFIRTRYFDSKGRLAMRVTQRILAP